MEIDLCTLALTLSASTELKSSELTPVVQYKSDLAQAHVFL
jgi:hypothetical protein